MISLSKLPSPPGERCVEFPKLDGGLNLLELDYRLDANEAPEMKNLWWRDGVLCSRDGQVRLTGDEALGTGWSAYELLFWGRGFFHIGDKLFFGDLSDPDRAVGTLRLTQLAQDVPEGAGAWFRYGDCLCYKNPGSYIQIEYNKEEDVFSAHPVIPYAPVILINTEPAACAGDVYQPENRICPQKTVWYTAALSEELKLDAYETGDALLQAINEAMKAGKGIKEYHLPVQDVQSVDYVEVDEQEIPVVETLPVYGEGAELPEAPTCCVVDLAAGTVTFDVAPRFHWPARPNTVKISYTKENADAYRSIMDCKYVAVYGGDQNVCVVLAGCPAQPNAYFWSGNHTVMDPGYFPMEQYNLAGDAGDAITGFGRQQNMLVVFKERSVGRAAFGTVEMGSGRMLLTMDYTAINARVGCDLPGSIQLIENNLVFCNTGQGVHLIRDSSAAYENNIVCISRKVNGEPRSKGLLRAAQRAGRDVTSFDDDQRYWLAAGGEVYCWDYTISPWTDPSWTYLTGIRGVAFIKGEGAGYHLDALGRVSALRRNWQDYGEGIDKRYRFAAQHFGSLDRLKDVTRCVFTVRGDTDTTIDIQYDTDYGTRRDLTPIRVFSWRLFPRNMVYRYLGVTRFAAVAVRRPGCRHVRHFAMELSNATAGQDMAVISAEVYYRNQGRDR